MKTRDWNIEKSIRREINLSQKVIKDKKKYTRKVKHANNCNNPQEL